MKTRNVGLTMVHGCHCCWCTQKQTYQCVNSHFHPTKEAPTTITWERLWPLSKMKVFLSLGLGVPPITSEQLGLVIAHLLHGLKLLWPGSKPLFLKEGNDFQQFVPSCPYFSHARCLHLMHKCLKLVFWSGNNMLLNYAFESMSVGTRKWMNMKRRPHMQKWLIPTQIISSHCMWPWVLLVKMQRPKLFTIVGMLVLFLMLLSVLQLLTLNTTFFTLLFIYMLQNSFKLQQIHCYDQWGHVMMWTWCLLIISSSFIFSYLFTFFLLLHTLYLLRSSINFKYWLNYVFHFCKISRF